MILGCVNDTSNTILSYPTVALPIVAGTTRKINTRKRIESLIPSFISKCGGYLLVTDYMNILVKPS